MKRILLALVFAASMIFSAAAEESKESSKPVWDHGDNVAAVTYTNVRFYKIYDAKDAYVVLYEKEGVKIGTAVLPKKWTENKDGPRKLIFRKAPKKIPPYMTIIKKGDEFNRVWVTVPLNRFHPVWAMAPASMSVEGVDADSLNLEL